MLTSIMVELTGARWLKTVVSDVSGNISSTSVPTWENDLITQVATTAGQQETLATYSYDVDGDGRPVRMVEVGQPEPKTLEVYDDEGRHLFQAVYASGSEPVGVRLYRDNTEPPRSLLAGVYPEAVASNDWLWASFDLENAAAIGQGLVGLRRPKPLDLVPWQPLAFDKSASCDFAKDLDGDDEEDVAARYTFDDQDRLSTFVLELGQAPRVTVQMTYTSELVTETIEYLDGTAEERRYHYGCDDFTLP